MNILLFKLIATPIFIGTATLAGRRWGSVVNGLIVGLPLTTGPISFILASQYGLEFSTRAASGNLAGQISICVFCLTYSRLARNLTWVFSAVGAVCAYMASTLILNRFSWQLFPAFIALLLVILIALRLIPKYPLPAVQATRPAWDLPARIVIATAFVLGLTGSANLLGPQLSGLVSTFPMFGIIFAIFTHAQQGAQAVSNLMRGIVLGSFSYIAFFLVVGLGLVPLGIPTTYTLALTATLITSGSVYFVSTRPAFRME